MWYTKEAEEAARFYAAVFPDSHVDRVTSLPADSAIGPAGSVVIVDFTLFGQTFMAMSAGPNDPFNEAISFRVNCRAVNGHCLRFKCRATTAVGKNPVGLCVPLLG